MKIELKDFFSETLIQIIEGVKTAQDYAKENRAYIAPAVLSDHTGIAHTVGRNSSSTSVVEFDVAVTGSESGTDKGRVGVLIAVLGATGESISEESKSTISHVKFAIPVVLPPQN